MPNARKNPKIASLFMGLSVSLLLAGCTSSSVLVPYPNRIDVVRKDIKENDFSSAEAAMTPHITSDDGILFLQERGRIRDLAGNNAGSKIDFESASQRIEEARMQASFSLQSIGASGASVFFNDNAIPYPGYGYEKVFIHTFQALNYLEDRDIEGALVEMRRIQNEQRYALERRAFEIGKTDQDAARHRIDWRSQEKELQEVYKNLNAAIGDLKSEFQNGYAFFITGLLHELNRDYDNARVSYTRALELYPKNRFLKDALKQVKSWSPELEEGKGRLIILYEEGFAPPRRQIKLPLPWAGRIYTLTLPYYSGGITAGPPLTLRVGRYTKTTELVCETLPLAARALKEDYKSIVIRHFLRLILRDQTQKMTQRKDEGAGIGLALLGFIVDNADLRSWLTLPRSMQIARVELPEGSYPISLSAPGAPQKQWTLNIASQGTTVIRVIRVGSQLHLHFISKNI